MKRGVAIVVAAMLTAGCAHHGNAVTAPATLPTLPPTSAIKDSFLYAAAKTRLAGADIDAGPHISVIVRDGVVTLRGPVANAAQRTRFVKLIASMRGVRSVNDELHIGRVVSVFDAVHDASLVAAVASTLTEQAGVNVTGISVHADRGTVTLRGHAPTDAIRSTLVAAAKHTPGVRNVIDRITVR